MPPSEAQSCSFAIGVAVSSAMRARESARSAKVNAGALLVAVPLSYVGALQAFTFAEKAPWRSSSRMLFNSTTKTMSASV